jgi:hypothetical protein
MCKKSCSCSLKKPAIFLTENLKSTPSISLTLKRFIEHNIPLKEHTSCVSSKRYLQMMDEARSLYSRGILNVEGENKSLLENKKLGLNYIKINLNANPNMLNENLNPEVSNAVNRFIKAMAKRYDYSEQDAVYAIMAALKQRKFDGLNESQEEDEEVDYSNISSLEDELRRLRRWSSQYGSKGADSKIEYLEQRIEYLKSNPLNEDKGSFSTLEDLESAIDNLSDKIGEVDVQNDLSYFQPGRIKIKTNKEGWKDKVKDILNQTLALDGGDEINVFRLWNYGNDNEGHYIQLRSNKSKKFDDDMSSGKYGKLD